MNPTATTSSNTTCKSPASGSKPQNFPHALQRLLLHALQRRDALPPGHASPRQSLGRNVSRPTHAFCILRTRHRRRLRPRRWRQTRHRRRRHCLRRPLDLPPRRRRLRRGRRPPLRHPRHRLGPPHNHWRAFMLAGVFAGLAGGSKFPILPLLVVAVPLAILLFSSLPLDRSVHACAVYGFSAFVLFSPWFIRNFRWTGNPIFPEAMSVLGQAHFSDVQVERWRRRLSPRRKIPPY